MTRRLSFIRIAADGTRDPLLKDAAALKAAYLAMDTDASLADMEARLNPLVASAALFGPASIVLASVTPIAVRLAARSLERLGRTAGRLFSVSTAGSIVGTFATAFWLVPSYGTDQLMALGAVGLGDRGVIAPGATKG